ncbi:SGNH/GDSL hydrolase family protein [Dactylosporangium salmoneum]|uniref:GDSL-type esterase/lipase family protein n=1 Tax=Dactylosporangium salmoneum TaxID=53361 RepID=A0ABP5ULY6_9ACTN
MLRRILLAAALAATSAVALPTPASAALPTAAVALGDSFISGEGAGSYQPVTDVNGVAQAFPGWSAPNSNAFFCHRSANASLLQASLAGIQDRYNLACSGGRPADFTAPGSARDKGRAVAAQLDQLRAVAQTHDIDLVLVGLGSNNSSFTFGDVAEKCANRFIADAWTGWWEFWAYLNGPVEQSPCTADDLATAAQFAAATAETVNAVRQLLTTLNQVDADHQHRVVFQDYTNPLPFDLDPSYWEADGRQDDRDKFRELGAVRYAAGCPIHRASLSAGHLFSQGLGTLVQTVRNTLAAEFPNDDLVFLDVQHAFDGARLCEHPGSPANALATPIRLQDGPSGTFVTSLSGKDKIAIQRIANTCVSYFQTCQESWHPTAAGQAVLAQCLSAAATTPARALTCSRQPDGRITTA